MVPLPPLRDGARALPISSFRQSMPSFDTRCPGLHLQPGASVVLGCVGELPGSRCTDFNPRTPCGARLCISTGPDPRAADFNPRAPCGARRHRAAARWLSRNFNPRAPCGARRGELTEDKDIELFQSTRPVWGATGSGRGDNPHRDISIHAPRVGRDAGFVRWGNRARKNFNPRAPCGARRGLCPADHRGKHDFNPRAPCGARLQI